MSFRKRIKITFIDIDSAGVVFYSRLLHNFHIAMEEFFAAELGMDYDDVIHERNLSLPTVRIEADFLKRMRYKDEIDVEVSIRDIGTASITWGYKGYRVGDGLLVFEGSSVTVCVRTDNFEKIPVPDWFRKLLDDYTAKG
jgi:4-hydroxybenzoyl-CoA thioesterase